MPCRVDEHPSDNAIEGVHSIKREGQVLLDWIISLSPRLMRFSIVYNQRGVIRRHLLHDAKLKYATRASWPGDQSTDAELMITAEHRRALEFHAAYKPLYELLVVECCTLMKLSEAIPGKFLSREMADWWKYHKGSAGHVEDV